MSTRERAERYAELATYFRATRAGYAMEGYHPPTSEELEEACFAAANFALRQERKRNAGVADAVEETDARERAEHRAEMDRVRARTAQIARVYGRPLEGDDRYDPEGDAIEAHIAIEAEGRFSSLACLIEQRNAAVDALLAVREFVEGGGAIVDTVDAALLVCGEEVRP